MIQLRKLIIVRCGFIVPLSIIIIQIEKVLATDYSKVSNKRTVFNYRTGGDIILQKV